MSRRNKGRFSKIKKDRRYHLRRILTESQNHKCAYCGFEMFNHAHEDVNTFAKRVCIPPSVVIRHLDVSVDHVDPKGENGWFNMVVCHSYCNNVKRSLDAVIFFAHVQRKLSQGDWPVQKLFKRR